VRLTGPKRTGLITPSHVNVARFLAGRFAAGRLVRSILSVRRDVFLSACEIIRNEDESRPADAAQLRRLIDREAFVEAEPPAAARTSRIACPYGEAPVLGASRRSFIASSQAKSRGKSGEPVAAASLRVPTRQAESLRHVSADAAPWTVR